MNADLGELTARVFARWGWKCVPVVTLLWTLFWPVGLVWLALSLARRYQSSDHSRPARAERRANWLASCYPPGWRARYGEDFAETVRQSILGGHGGLRLALNVYLESSAAWWQADRRGLITVTCWWLCCVPLVPQGLVPLAIKLGGGTSRGWFAALFLPGVLQWGLITVMLTAGTVMLAVAVRGTPALRQTGHSGPGQAG
jgi:hypothetical protein